LHCLTPDCSIPKQKAKGSEEMQTDQITNDSDFFSVVDFYKLDNQKLVS
jgi:hypothetical protein